MSKQKKAKRPEITVCGFVLLESGPTPLEALTEEQRASWQERMRQRLSEGMSDYYTQHPGEYKRLCESLDGGAYDQPGSA